MSQELNELIQKCCQQDKEAQAKLYQLFSSKIFGVCLQYSRSYEDAEDALQDGFLLIFDKIKSFKFQGSFEGWIKRVVINNILKKLKKLPRLEKIAELKEQEYKEEISFKKEETLNLDVLLKLVQQLPDQYRFVFNLYVLDNFSHKEIATLLNISVGTSKSNLHRARQLLKEKVAHIQKKTS